VLSVGSAGRSNPRRRSDQSLDEGAPCNGDNCSRSGLQQTPEPQLQRVRPASETNSYTLECWRDPTLWNKDVVRVQVSAKCLKDNRSPQGTAAACLFPTAPDYLRCDAVPIPQWFTPSTSGIHERPPYNPARALLRGLRCRDSRSPLARMSGPLV